jgi:hypothetical protein
LTNAQVGVWYLDLAKPREGLDKVHRRVVNLQLPEVNYIEVLAEVDLPCRVHL